MLKSLIIYRLSKDWTPKADLFEESLEREAFTPCGATQALSVGWVPPRGDSESPLLEIIDGQWLLTLRAEKRILPASVIREALEDRLDHIEQETGRRPGKKAQTDLKEQVTLELLPRAFTTSSHARVWIDPTLGLLMVDAGSVSKADEVVTMLVKADPSINLHLLQSAEAPAACMGAWLMDGIPPEGFTIDRDLELKAADEMKSAVRFTRHNLDRADVRDHLTGGKMPTRLAMTWKERISFVLTDSMQIKGVKFLDVVFDGRDKPAKDEAFDVDAALATGELSRLIPALIEALGGELDFIGQSAKIAAEHAPREAVPPHVSGDGPDPIYRRAVEIVRAQRRASVSLLQRMLMLGYNRASRLLDRMVAEGVLEPPGPDGRYVLAAAIELTEPTP
ncbi:recombination-associated protein RdgC [Roseateles sp.]|uniref:recombination-associated protein RdgC n=1 Tax=Roseateles sp. TaxID=1971397 RepID=UPI0031D63C16